MQDVPVCDVGRLSECRHDVGREGYWEERWMWL